MTPTRRLVTGTVIAVAGAAIAAVGSSTAWYTIERPGRPLTIPGLGRTSVGSSSVAVTGSELVPWVVPVAVLMLIAALLVLLVGPRARALCLALVVLGAPAVIVAWAAIAADRVVRLAPEDVDISTRVGSLVACIGAVVAAAGAFTALPAARRVDRLRMPETPQA